MTEFEKLVNEETKSGRKPGNRIFERYIVRETGLSLQQVRSVITCYQRILSTMARAGREFKITKIGAFSFRMAPCGLLSLRFKVNTCLSAAISRLDPAKVKHKPLGNPKRRMKDSALVLGVRYGLVDPKTEAPKDVGTIDEQMDRLNARPGMKKAYK